MVQGAQSLAALSREVASALRGVGGQRGKEGPWAERGWGCGCQAAGLSSRNALLPSVGQFCLGLCQTLREFAGVGESTATTTFVVREALSISNCPGKQGLVNWRCWWGGGAGGGCGHQASKQQQDWDLFSSCKEGVSESWRAKEEDERGQTVAYSSQRRRLSVAGA